MLEQPRKVGSKVISHMLASHGGEIFLHCLATSRSSLEDPPSISEGCGGRVTDYRITDFGEFMRENRLAPCQPTPETEEEAPIERGQYENFLIIIIIIIPQRSPDHSIFPAPGILLCSFLKNYSTSASNILREAMYYHYLQTV